MREQIKWWQKAVFYQIYPRSFADGNGDGIGDFKGMIAKLDYLKELGIDAAWLSPHFPSPYVDCGYDISDYRGVAPEYGDLDLFKQFLNGLHARGIKLVLDLVLNHTSDLHPWFQESKSSLNNPKRDWYIWKKGNGKQAPNNWYSAFGGSAWEYDAATDEYYYHYFFKEQPDLNWKNPAVKEAMFNEARFWLNMGVDGFRLDAVGTIFEDESYSNIKLKIDQDELFRLSQIAETAKDHTQVHLYWMKMFKHQVDQPEVHQIMKDLRKVINKYEDRVLIGETDDVAFYGNNDDELQLNFNFPLMRTKKLSAEHVRKNQKERLSALPVGAWPCNTLGNHDSSRAFSYFGDGVNDNIQARLNLMLLLSLKGTPFLYNGEEIGMSDYLITDPKKFKDPLSTLYYNLDKKVMGAPEPNASLTGAERGRDKCRTPLQWTNEPNAGFCPAGIEPWLPVNPDYRKGINVKEQEKQTDSLLNFYRFMLKVRRENPALISGEYQEIETDNQSVLVFYRRDAQQVLLLALNLSDTEQQVVVNTHDLYKMKIIANTVKQQPNVSIHSLALSSYQGLILSEVQISG
ncbi:MAG: alpha-glucosidase [Chloroflexi bacterium]|nr:MAG: alpha-glucosidase [Chloroflexota bacterium]